jgi:hypothetical protein
MMYCRHFDIMRDSGRRRKQQNLMSEHDFNDFFLFIMIHSFRYIQR